MIVSGWCNVRGRHPRKVFVPMLATLALTARSGVAQEEVAPPMSPDAPLPGAWKLRLDAPLILIRSAEGEASGQQIGVSTTSFGLPASGANLQLGYAATASTNLGLQLGWVQSESKVTVEGAEASSTTVKSSQYRVGVYGEHLFLGTGSVHPSLGAVGELLGGDAGQVTSGLGLGANGAVQVFIGKHASLDFNVRCEWLSLSVGEAKTSGFEFAGGFGVSLWFGGRELQSDSPSIQMGSTQQTNTAPSEGAPTGVSTDGDSSRASDSDATATVQFAGATTLTVSGEPAEPTFQLLVRRPEGECTDVRFVVADQEEVIENVSPVRIASGSSDAVVFRGEIPAKLVRRMANASVETPVRVRACGRDDMAGFFDREPLREFLR